MQESQTAKIHPILGYATAFFIWVGAFIVGNILGRIIASMQGWENFSYDRAGGVFYAAIQGGLGSYFALIASKHWLGDARFARFWLALFVWLCSGLVAAAVILALYLGRADFLRWSTLATIAGLVTTEIVRRVPDRDLG